jgi:SAM-dependent methyltransferase
MTSFIRRLARSWLPVSVRRLPRRLTARPPVGTVRFGGLRRLNPISSDWGFERGLPIDRYYIERFLESERESIRGRVLEIDNNAYTRRFGGGRVERSDVLHISELKPGVTLVGDLTNAEHLPTDAFDCVVLTQTLQLIYDVRAALRTVHRILKPGGVLLATVPGISRMTKDEEGLWGYFWGFTTLSANRLLAEVFPPAGMRVEARGNVLTATSFLHGIAAGELKDTELEHADPPRGRAERL